MSPEPLGLIAGGGLMPIRVADAAAKAGRQPCIILLEGFAELTDYDRFPGAEIIALGQVGRMQSKLRNAGAKDLVMAGRVTRPSFMSLRLDAEGVRLAAKLGRLALFGGDDSLLTACLKLMREQGFNPMGAQEVMAELLVEPGPLTSRTPDEQARADIARGIAVVRALGGADVGQGCVVQQGMVLGLEAIEGTDAMLARCGALRREGPGGVLIKLMKPTQDRRVDMPVIGPDTVAYAAAAGLRGIAIQARFDQAGTIVLDRGATIAAAEAAGLFLLAILPNDFLNEFNRDDSP